jgi:hypothetical protein
MSSYTIVHMVPYWGPEHVVGDETGENCFCAPHLVRTREGHHVVHRDPLSRYFFARGVDLHPAQLYIDPEVNSS